MTVKLPKNKVSCYLVLPDPHIEAAGNYVSGIDMKTWSAVRQYLKAQPVDKYDGIVLLGDVGNFNCISPHNKENYLAAENGRLKRDYQAIQTFLDDLWDVAGPPIWWLQGNHEFWVDRLIQKNPALSGVIDIPVAMELEKQGITWVPSWSTGELLTIGKANFTHGLHIRRNYAAAMVADFDVNIFFGHTHSRNLASKVSLGQNSTKAGESLGCLCEYNPSYMRGRPDKWQQAFGEFFFFPNGMFTRHITDIFDHSFIDSTGKVWRPEKNFKMEIQG